MSLTQTITGREIAERAIPLIEKSKKQIDTIVYIWLWYPNEPGSNIQRFNNAIINAIKRNVNIRAIAEPEKTRKILKENGVKTKQYIGAKKIHTKLMIIDNQTAIIGSHNYTKNAFNLNEEVSLIVNDEETIKRLREYFENLWAL